MKQKDRERLEERLQEERESALKALRAAEDDEKMPQSESAGDVSRFPSHMADGGSNTEEQEKDFLVASQESERLNRISEALELLHEDPERYEHCDECGAAIGYERLDLIPWTRQCVECARASEP